MCTGKGRVVPLINSAPSCKDVWGSGGIVPCILNLGTRWKWSASSLDCSTLSH